MSTPNFFPRIFAFLFLVTVALLLSTSHLFTVVRIAPDYVLIVLILAAFAGFPLLAFAGLAAVVVALAYTWMPFWLWGWIPAVALMVVVRLIRYRFTGNRMVDYLGAVALGTVLVYTLSSLRFLSFHLLVTIGVGVLLNVALAAAVWVALERLHPYEAIRS